MRDQSQSNKNAYKRKVGIQLKIQIRKQNRHDSHEIIVKIFIPKESTLLKVASRRNWNKGIFFNNSRERENFY